MITAVNILAKSSWVTLLSLSYQLALCFSSDVWILQRFLSASHITFLNFPNICVSLVSDAHISHPFLNYTLLDSLYGQGGTSRTCVYLSSHCVPQVRWWNAWHSPDGFEGSPHLQSCTPHLILLLAHLYLHSQWPPYTIPGALISGVIWPLCPSSCGWAL